MQRGVGALALLLLWVTSAAAGVIEDDGSYPPGVQRVERTEAAPAEEFRVDVVMTPDAGADGVWLYVCHYGAPGDDEPAVCYSPVTGKGYDRWFTADTADGHHPVFERGWELGYKLRIAVDGEEVAVPADGGYYRVLVGAVAAVQEIADEPAEASPAPAVAAFVLCLALAWRRRP